jgi:hypothetical protein
VLTDNRHGLVVNVQATAGDGYAERDIAERKHLAEAAKQFLPAGSSPLARGAELGSVFSGLVMAIVILDRLGHHSHVIATSGASYRRRAKRRAELMHQASQIQENTSTQRTNGQQLSTSEQEYE